MKNICFILFLLLISNGYGAIPEINVENLKANYFAPSGNANADTFKYEGVDYGKNLSIEMQAGELVLSAVIEEFRLSKLPRQITDAKSLKVEEISLKSNQKFIELVSKRIDFTDGEDNEKYITGVNIKCEGSSKFYQDVLDMCLNQKLTFYLPYLKGLSINNINIWGDNNKLSFSFKNKVWIKGYGGLFFDEAKNMIRVRIDKAKTGFINVTSKVFAELKAMENEFITVNRPWIYIQLPN